MVGDEPAGIILREERRTDLERHLTTRRRTSSHHPEYQSRPRVKPGSNAALDIRLEYLLLMGSNSDKPFLFSSFQFFEMCFKFVGRH